MANRDFSHPFAGASAELYFPGDFTRGAKGFHVRRAQEWLVYHGAHLAVDSEFGPATEQAVLAFQVRAGILPTANGAVDEATWRALTTPLARAMRPIDPTGKTFNELVCLYARQHLVEKPIEIGGPNDGPWVRAYMLGNGGKPWQWCAGFACFILAQARTAGVPMPIVPSFGVPEVVRSAKARGRFLPDGPATPGDLFVIPTATSWCHIGIVLEYTAGSPKFLSAEGNTNAEGGSDGVCARSVLRNPARCDFIRVAP